MLDIPFPDPDKYYYWPAISRPLTGLEAVRKGYVVVVGKEHCEKLFGAGSAEYMLNAQGRVQVEDHYLMEIDRERLDAIRRAQAIQDEIRRGAPIEQFYAEFDRLKAAGITGFIETIEESRDKKQFESRKSVNRVGYTPPTATPRARRNASAQE